MSIRIMSRVWDEADASGGSLLVLLALANFADDDGLCWPRIETVAAKARLTTRQVSSIITSLVQSEQIATRPGGGRGRPTTYAVMCGMSDQERAETLKKLHGKSQKSTKNFQGNEPESTKKLQGLAPETLKPRNFFSETGIAESGSATPDQHEIRHGGDPSLDSDPPPPHNGGGGGEASHGNQEPNQTSGETSQQAQQAPPQPQPDPDTIRLLNACNVSAKVRRELGHVPAWIAERTLAHIRQSGRVQSEAGALVAELRAWVAEHPEGADDESRPVGSRAGRGLVDASRSTADDASSHISPERLAAAKAAAREQLAAYQRK